MRSAHRYCVAIILLCIGVVSAIAEPRSVDLAPLVHENAKLVVVNRDGSPTACTPAGLQEFPTYQIETTTPWREESAVISGVLLFDVLVLHKLFTDVTVRVTAECDYSALVDANTLKAALIVVATRVNGAPHSRRMRGPFQFVIEDGVYQSNDLLSETHLVWMASRIEVAR